MLQSRIAAGECEVNDEAWLGGLGRAGGRVSTMMHKEPAGFRNQLRNRFCNRLQKELGKDFQNRAPAWSLQSRELVPAWKREIGTNYNVVARIGYDVI
jgi:hypothetical protein